MAEPRLSVSFTVQDLINMAFCARCAAIMARKDAEAATSVTVKDHHLAAATTYERMAGRFEELKERLEKRIAQKD